MNNGVKYRVNFVLDVITIAVTIAMAIAVLILGEPKQKFMIIALAIMIIGYLIYYGKAIPTKIMNKNIEEEIKKKNDFESFLNMSEDEIKEKYKSLSAYISDVYKYITYDYIEPKYFGFKTYKKIISKGSNYIRISINIKDIFNKMSTISVITEGEKINEISIKFNDFSIIMTDKELKTKDENNKEIPIENIDNCKNIVDEI